MSGTTHGTRIDRVEKEVASIQSDIGSIKSDVVGLASDVRGLAGILGRIEEGVNAAQARADTEKQASRLNPIALATVLITIISILVGGAWLIGGNQARLDERSKISGERIDRLDQRQWEERSRAVEADPQRY